MLSTNSHKNCHKFTKNIQLWDNAYFGMIQTGRSFYPLNELSGNKNIEIGRIFSITWQAVSNIIRQVDKKIEENNRIEKEIL